MRILLDESLPRRLAFHFTADAVETVPQRGWSGLRNGELLARASGTFDVFVTADQNLQYQQNLAGFDIGVVVLAGRTNRLEDLIPLAPAANEACQAVAVGQVLVVRGGAPDGAS